MNKPDDGVSWLDQGDALFPWLDALDAASVDPSKDYRLLLFPAYASTELAKMFVLVISSFHSPTGTVEAAGEGEGRRVPNAIRTPSSAIIMRHHASSGFTLPPPCSGVPPVVRPPPEPTDSSRRSTISSSRGMRKLEITNIWGAAGASYSIDANPLVLPYEYRYGTSSPKSYTY